MAEVEAKMDNYGKDMSFMTISTEEFDSIKTVMKRNDHLKRIESGRLSYVEEGKIIQTD